MVKKYIRICDNCKKEVKNLYDFGVTILYNQIRIGRGFAFKDWDDGSIHNLMEHKTADDYDTYGKGYSDDDNKEFIFCSPECLLEFFRKLYTETYNTSLKSIKETKYKEFKESFKLAEKKQGESIPFFNKIQSLFSKNHFKKTAIAEVNTLLKELTDLIKKLR